MREPLKDRLRLEHIVASIIKETAVHKSLIQTAERMKQRGYDVSEICKITGLTRDEIESL